MIEFHRQTLKNGLVVLVHEDPSTPLVACNLLYKVGSRDEDPERTGLAHLFEHLMFSGTPEVPDFDKPIQEAGGENNAYTNTPPHTPGLLLPGEHEWRQRSAARHHQHDGACPLPPFAR